MPGTTLVGHQDNGPGTTLEDGELEDGEVHDDKLQELEVGHLAPWTTTTSDRRCHADRFHVILLPRMTAGIWGGFRLRKRF